MTPKEALKHAEALIHNAPVEHGPDPRWQAIVALGEFVESSPKEVWQFTKRWGSSPDEDLRATIATCLLEHLLEYHFTKYFPRVEALVKTSPLFGKAFQVCSEFGQTTLPENAKRFLKLRNQLV